MDVTVDSAGGDFLGRQWFGVTEEQFVDFQRLLDAPVALTAGFDRLFSRPSCA
jgi:uncharacterized protein (DUF1778 family)